MLVYEDSRYGPLMAGQASLKDRAVGDEVEMLVGTSSDVRYKVTPLAESKSKRTFRIELSNARNEPVNVEVEFPFELNGKPKGIAKVDGIPTWKVTLPANGEATLNYAVKLR